MTSSDETQGATRGADSTTGTEGLVVTDVSGALGITVLCVLDLILEKQLRISEESVVDYIDRTRPNRARSRRPLTT